MSEIPSWIPEKAESIRSTYKDAFVAKEIHRKEGKKFGELATSMEADAQVHSPNSWDRQNLIELANDNREIGKSFYEQADKYQREEDNALHRAHQHKEDHLDQYIETARQEAEAEGVHINLEPPKE
jgi:hypothetical protein